jgi:hypothetical protein
MEKRAEYEAYERRQAEDAGDRDDEDEDEDEDEEEAEASDEAGDEAAEGDEEEAPKKKPAKEAKPRSRPRSRAAKVVRVKMVWGVFNNANVRVATYEYPQRRDAEEHAAKLTADKKSTHFVQPVKEPIEEKKEA